MRVVLSRVELDRGGLVGLAARPDLIEALQKALAAMLGATLLPLPRLPTRARRGCHLQRPTLFLRSSSVSLQPEPATTGWIGCPCPSLPACQACHQARMPYRAC